MNCISPAGRVRKIRPIVPAIAALLVVAGGPGAAQTVPSFDALSRLDLVDLAQIRVTVASKRAEQLADAPGVVSIITRREIRRLGAISLSDVLNRAPGLQAIGSHFYPHTVSIRGQMFAHSNNDVLFLINGRPHRTSWNGGTPERVLLGFPLSAIERIEIIRGPGSVLYGTGATSGVVNIVTVPAEEIRNGYAALTYGSRETAALEATGSAMGQAGAATVSVRGLASDGWTFTATDEAGVTDSAARGRETFGAMATAHHGSWAAQALYTDVELDNLLGGPPVWPAGRHNTRHLFFDLGYSAPLNDRWNLDTHITFNDFGFAFVDTPPQVNERNSRDTLLEITADGAVREDFRLLLGASSEYLSGTVAPGDQYASYRTSLYAEAHYTPADAVQFTVGMQWDKVEATESSISPRIALIKRFNTGWGVKVLYGEAFRSAVATERFLDTPSLLGHPSLEPKLTATTETQVFYSEEHYFAALTYFRTEFTNLIDRVPIGGGQFRFGNQGELDSRGIELEAKGALTPRLEVLGSASHQENENDAGQDTSLAPDHMAKLGFIYEGEGPYSVGVFNAYFSDPTPVREVNPAVAQVNPRPDGYHVLTAQLRLDLQRILRFPGSRPFTLALFGDNLLDEDIYFPEFNRRNINSIPIAGGRAVYATLEVGI